MTVSIRPAVPADAEALAALHNAAVKKCCTSYDTGAIKDWLSRYTPEHFSTFIESKADSIQPVRCAEKAGKLVGYIAQKGSNVSELFVSPEQQGQGVGKMLTAHAEEAAKAQKIAWLWVNSTPNAEAFYKAVGFEVVCSKTRRVNGFSYPVMVMQRFL